MKLLSTIASGILGIWIADRFVSGVDFSGSWQTLLLAGLALGAANFFVKPIVNLVTLPLRFVTLGLFGILINIAIIWAIDILFKELVMEGVTPLLWTTLIVWGLGLFLPKFFPARKPKIMQ